jgi:hypothetical protein
MAVGCGPGLWPFGRRSRPKGWPTRPAVVKAAIMRRSKRPVPKRPPNSRDHSNLRLFGPVFGGSRAGFCLGGHEFSGLVQAVVAVELVADAVLGPVELGVSYRLGAVGSAGDRTRLGDLADDAFELVMALFSGGRAQIVTNCKSND